MIDDTPANKKEVKYLYDQLPNKLKLRHVFCKWKRVMRNDSNTKLPFTVKGKPASSTDRRCFTDFETVCANLDGYDGIGIGIFDDMIRLLNHPVYICKAMDDVAPGNIPVMFGDFQHYWIGDRGKRVIKRLVERYADRGQVAFVTTERVDAKLVLPEAVKMLKVSGTPTVEAEE